MEQSISESNDNENTCNLAFSSSGPTAEQNSSVTYFLHDLQETLGSQVSGYERRQKGIFATIAVDWNKIAYEGRDTIFWPQNFFSWRQVIEGISRDTGTEHNSEQPSETQVYNQSQSVLKAERQHWEA